MKIVNTSEPKERPSVVMLVYGEGGVGKTTFSVTAPNPIIIDCEGGTKYLGLRGIKVDVGQVKNWQEARQGVIEAVDSGKYNTIIIDPIGELVEKAKVDMVKSGNSKLVQKDGAPTMAGWGQLKERMRNLVKYLRDSGKHVIIIAHIDEKADEDRMIKRPMIQTKLSEEIINIVDVVGYMTVATTTEGEAKRVIIVDPENDKYVAKDRSGQLGRIIEPDFSKIIKACNGTGDYKWMKPQAKKGKSEEVKKDEKDILEDLTVEDLKGICEGKGLKVSGNKDELVSRIIESGGSPLIAGDNEPEAENEAKSRLKDKIKNKNGK